MGVLSLHLLFLAVASGLFWLCAVLWRKRVLLRLLGVPAVAPMLTFLIIGMIYGELGGGAFGVVAVVWGYVYMAVLSLLCVLVQEMIVPWVPELSGERRARQKR